MGSWIAAWIIYGLLVGEFVIQRDKKGSNTLTASEYMVVVILGPVLIAMALGFKLMTGKWPGQGS